MSDPVYKRILIKISGEALAGDKKTGFDFDFMSKVCERSTKAPKWALRSAESSAAATSGAALRTERAMSSASRQTVWVCLQRR